MVLHQDGSFEYDSEPKYVLIFFFLTWKLIYRITHECSHGQNIVALAVVSDEFALGHVAVIHDVVVAIAIPSVANAFSKLEFFEII